MKKILYVLLLCITNAHAQNYQCLQSGVRHYFINSIGYLRGMRIDSVKIFPDSTIYYPFHTPRGYYNPYSAIGDLDSNGGSWLGKKVIQLSDGTCLFDNHWGDTVIIKTQAVVGDSWVFCRDTSAVYYQALVTGRDTMTILGAVDSVKKILITARNNAGIVATEYADSLQIILSKNNGFVSIFDLYTFPYHLADTSYTVGLDYYLDESFYSIPDGYSLYIPGTSIPNHKKVTFNLISLINPTRQQLYDWNVGDVYEYKECFPSHGMGSTCDPPMEYVLDTIQAKSSTGTLTTYAYTGMTSNLNTLYPPHGPYNYYYPAVGDGGTLIYNTTLLIDTAIMPEEFKQTKLYFYYPDDTTYCLNAPLYISLGSYLVNATYSPPFEHSTPSIVNKLHLGLVHYYDVGMDAAYYVSDTTLAYYNRQGVSCGIYTNPVTLPTKVDNYASAKKITLSPNPATTMLTIMYSNKITSISISNLLGQVVYTHAYNDVQVEVNIAGLPGGFYIVKVNNTEMKEFIKN